MADDERDKATESGEGEGAPSPKSGKKKKRLLILIFLLIVLVGGGVGGWLVVPGLLSSTDDLQAGNGTDAEGQASSKKGKEAEENQEMGVLYSLKPFIVNLVDPTGKRYLKVKLDLDLSDEETKIDVEYRMPQIKDSLLILLSSKTYEDIASIEGKMRLRMEIIGRINNTISIGKVNNVYFTEFVVQ